MTFIGMTGISEKLSRGRPGIMHPERRVGTQIANYFLEALLGKGGMGVVYRARHVITGERVAVKLMAPTLALDDDFRRRFLREADYFPALRHPNVVPVHEVGESAGLLFIAMELIEGSDLKELILSRKRIGLGRLVSIFAQAASALDAAHEGGIIHRDVKPQNLLFDKDDHLYVSDFGLVKRISSKSSVSSAGEILGSVHYIAPEQLEGKMVDGRADVYSLGCVLYECLTGQLPFDRELEIAVLFAHVQEERPTVSSVRSDLPPEFDAMVTKAMARAPEERHLTCGDLASELADAVRSTDTLAVPTARTASRFLSGPLKRRPKRLVTSYDSQGGDRKTWTPSFSPHRARTHTWSPGRSAATATSLGLLAIIAVLLITRGGWVNQVITESGEQLGSLFPGGEARSAGSEDSSTVAAEARLSKVLRGAPATELDTRGTAPGLTPPSRSQELSSKQAVNRSALVPAAASNPRSSPGQILFVNRGEVMSIDPRDGDKKNLTNNPASDSTPTLSPDGRSLVFWSNRYDRGDLFRMSIDGRNLIRLTPDLVYDTYPQWSPNGRSVVYASFPERRCLDPLCQRIVMGEGDIKVVRADGSRARTLVATGDNTHPSYSPDGQRIVFIRDGDLFLMGHEGSDLTRLMSSPEPETWPRWSPDGTKIVFARVGQIHVLDLNNGEVRRLSTNPTVTDAYPDWSPDGMEISFSRCACPNGAYDVMTMNADGTAVRKLHPGNSHFVEWGVSGR